MFKEGANRIEMNKVIEQFSPVLKCTHFEESDDRDFAVFNYMATNNDGWGISAYFAGFNLTTKTGRYYYPRFEFEKNQAQRFKQKLNNYTGQADDAIQAEKIMNHFHDLYQPNFDRAFEVIDTFLEQGSSLGIYNNVKKMPHDKHSSSQFYRYEDDKGYNRLFFNSKVFAKITFNNVLQTLRSGQTKFKKSHLSMDIVYLVSSNDTMSPYFKIRLPYSAHKKINCIISFDGEKMYLVSEDENLKKDFIDNLTQYPTDKDSLSLFFKEEFKKEIISVIAKTLKIKRKDLVKLSDDELRNHFILIEMIKL